MSPDQPLLIGVDVGTTRIKAGVIDLAGNELAQTAQPTVWQATPTGAQAVPTDFMAAVRAALAELLEISPAGEIAGIGITSMAETAVLIDARGEPVGPAIAWYDRRALRDMEEMQAALTRGTIGANTGLTPVLVPTVAILRHLMRTDVAARAATKVLSVAEWIAFELSGTIASELSLASRTGALQIASGRWWSEVIEWAELRPSLFPELQPAGSDWGLVTTASRQPGLERLAGATVTVGGHDHLVAAIGSGVSDANQIMDSCGTAEAVIRAIPAAASVDPRAALAAGISTGWHALPGHHCLMAGVALGIALTPLLERLGATHSQGHTSLDDAALATLAAAERETGDPSTPPTPAQEWLTGVQGVATQASAAIRELERIGGPIEEVRVSGGWARNPVVRRVKDLDPHRHVYPLVTEAGVRGAGLMAGATAGLFTSIAHLPAPPTAAGMARPAPAVVNVPTSTPH